MTESAAFKIELTDTIRRRFDGDQRSSDITAGITLAVVGEVIADVIFAVAQDQQHGERLLEVCNARVRSRWKELSAKAR